MIQIIIQLKISKMVNIVKIIYNYLIIKITILKFKIIFFLFIFMKSKIVKKVVKLALKVYVQNVYLQILQDKLIIIVNV